MLSGVKTKHRKYNYLFENNGPLKGKWMKSDNNLCCQDQDFENRKYDGKDRKHYTKKDGMMSDYTLSISNIKVVNYTVV